MEHHPLMDGGGGGAGAAQRDALLNAHGETALAAALDGCAAAARTRAARDSLSKADLIDVAAYKRNQDPSAWTRPVARAFQRALLAFDLPPTSDELPTEGAVPVVVGDDDAAGKGGAGDEEDVPPEMDPLAAVLVRRKRRLTLFTALVFVVLLLVVLGGAAAHRRFGPYSFSNVLLLLLAATGFAVSCRTWDKPRTQILVAEAFFCGTTVSLVVGALAGVFYIASVPGRVTDECNLHPNYCDGHSLGLLQGAAVVAAVLVTIAYGVTAAFGARAAKSYCEALKLSVAAEMGGVDTRTSLTSFTEWVGRWFVPSTGCLIAYQSSAQTAHGVCTAGCIACVIAAGACLSRGCSRRRVGGGRRRTSCNDDCSDKCCGWFAAFFCLFAIITSILCAITSSDLWCTLAEFSWRFIIEVIADALSNKH
mmetsp:Transcript_98/g.356  ORF Transcript_98/g.356 Transcript_98/m.356 type:complete len:422 (-) Transcript_98:165-1430(-)